MRKIFIILFSGVILRAEYFPGDTLHFYKNSFSMIFHRDTTAYKGVVRYKSDEYYIISHLESWRVSTITSFTTPFTEELLVGSLIPSFGNQKPDYLSRTGLQKIMWQRVSWAYIDFQIDGIKDMEIYDINIRYLNPIICYACTNEGVVGRNALVSLNPRKVGLLDTSCFDIVINPDSMFTSTSDTEIIYVATPYGVYRGEVELEDLIHIDSLAQFNLMGNLVDTVYSLAIDTLLGLYAGSIKGLYKWDTLLNEWLRKGDSIPVNEIKIFPTGEIIASTRDGIMYSVDGGNTWTRNLYSENIKGIEFYRDYYYAISYGEGVLRSNSLWKPVWEDISYGLEVLENFGSKNINVIYKDSITDSLFIGTDQGVYVFNTQKKKWINISTGEKIVDDIIIDIIKDSVKPDSIFLKERSLLQVADTELFDIDGDPRIFLVLTNIPKSNDTLLRGIFTCYFDPYDEDTTNPYANGFEGLILNLDEFYTSSDTFFPYRVMPVRNAISYLYGKYIFWSLDPNEDVLFLTGFGMLTGYLSGTKSLLWGMNKRFILKPNNLQRGVFEFRELPHNYVEMEERAKEKIFFFMEYLFERTDTNFIKYLLRDTLNGEEGLDSAFINNGYSFTTKDIFKDWIIASYINYPDSSFYNGIYGYWNVDTLPFLDCLMKTWSSYPIYPFPNPPNIYHPCKYSFSYHLFTNGSSPITIYFDGENEDTFYNIIVPIDTMGIPIDTYEMNLDILQRGNISLSGFGTQFKDFIFIISKLNKGKNGRFQYDDSLLSSIPSPESLKAYSHYPSYIPLKWEKPFIDNMYFYKIYRSLSPNGPFILIDTTFNIYYKDTTVMNDTLYYYKITANYGNEESPFSNMDSAFAEEFPPPQNIEAYPFFNDKIYLLWNMPYGYSVNSINFLRFLKEKEKIKILYQPELVGFRIYRKFVNSPDTFSIIADSINALHYFDSIPASDTTYLYSITAIYSNPSGESKIYDTLVVSPFIPPPGEKALIPIQAGRVWSYTTNFGCFAGGEIGYELLGYTHPSPCSINNYYLWYSYFAIGTVVNGDTFVTTHDYPDGEWTHYPYLKIDNYFSDLDITTVFHDFLSNPNNSPGRHTGIQVMERALSWQAGMLKDAIAYEFFITYHKDQCDLPGPPDTLKDVYIAFGTDCDVSGADNSNPHIDDLVDYEGYDCSDTQSDEIDSITLYPDGTYDTIPDGFLDEFDIFGDEPDEVTLNGDTLLVSRNAGYMFDWDQLSNIGNDIGENGYSKGYIAFSLIYAPLSPSDSVWIQGDDTLRMPLPSVMVWWNWENHPGTDVQIYRYMSGTHSTMLGYRFMPNPLKYSLGPVFDYRIFLCAGPFKIADGETIKIVLGSCVGQGLNGGYDSVYTDSWIPGMRHILDAVIKEYYRGSQISDPYHPTGPGEDYHWGVPPLEREESFHPFGKLIFNISSNPIYRKGHIYLFLPHKKRVNLYIYDVTGRKVVEILKNKFVKGSFKIPFPRNLRSGVYFLNLRLNKKNLVKRIIYIK